ncbi:MAG: hypothetical protein WDN48_01540 [Pseudolabrys sp.]
MTSDAVPFAAALHTVNYLEPAHYFGVDLNQSLIDESGRQD